MVDMSRIKALILKQLLSRLSKDEEKELQIWIDESSENREFMETRMTRDAFFKREHVLQSINTTRLDRLMKKKFGNIPGVLDWVPEPIQISKILKYAPAAVILMAFAFIWWFSRSPHTSQTLLPSEKPQQTIQATLCWQAVYKSGQVAQPTAPTDSITLDEMQEGMAYRTGQAQIVRMGNEVFIRPLLSVKVNEASPMSYTLTHTGLGELQLFFNDSIRVQLYSNTSLTFNMDPAGKISKERIMRCQGEALFDVNHNPQRPFLVKTKKQEVQALGTIFRVLDLHNEDTSAVFCYQGKVSVNNGGLTKTILVNSQRVTVDAAHHIHVSTGDFLNAKWSSPELLFDFSKKNLDSAMQEIAHWYGMPHIQFQPGLDRKTPGIVLAGHASRYLTLPQLLSVLERADLHFSIQGQTIIVKK